MSAVPEVQVAGPPILAYQTLVGVLDTFKSKGVPSLVDKGTFATQSGGTQSEIMRTLRFLNLIDGAGTPTKALGQLVDSYGDDAAFSETLLETISGPYDPLFQLPLETVTDSHLRKQIQDHWGISGDTSKKAMNFFLRAARASKVPLGSWLRVRDRAPSKGPRQVRKRRSTESEDSSGTLPTNDKRQQLEPPRRSKVSDHQLWIVEIVNSYPKMPADMRSSFLEAIGFIATQTSKEGDS